MTRLPKVIPVLCGQTRFRRSADEGGWVTLNLAPTEYGRSHRVQGRIRRGFVPVKAHESPTSKPTLRVLRPSVSDPCRTTLLSASPGGEDPSTNIFL